MRIGATGQKRQSLAGHVSLEVYLIITGYLISSRVHAVNLLATYTLKQLFEEGKDVEARLGRRQTRGAGLVLALQGSKILTKMVADIISARLKRPLVSLTSNEEDKGFPEASKEALRWGGVLHINTDFQTTYRAIELASYISFYPSVVLMTCNDTTELGAACENEIDGIIACNTSSDYPIPELWKVYLTIELPEVTVWISNQRLNDACRILAQLEPRESRMGKILKTANRITVAETSTVGFGHVIEAIRSSLSLARLEEVKNILAVSDELRRQLDSTTK